MNEIVLVITASEGVSISLNGFLDNYKRYWMGKGYANYLFIQIDNNCPIFYCSPDKFYIETYRLFESIFTRLHVLTPDNSSDNVYINIGIGEDEHTRVALWSGYISVYKNDVSQIASEVSNVLYYHIETHKRHYRTDDENCNRISINNTNTSSETNEENCNRRLTNNTNTSSETNKKRYKSNNIFFEHWFEGNSEHMKITGIGVIAIIALFIFIKNYWVHCLIALIVVVVGGIGSYLLYLYTGLNKLKAFFIGVLPTLLITFLILRNPIKESLGMNFDKKSINSDNSYVTTDYNEESFYECCTTADLNLRSGPSTFYSVVSVIPINTIIKVLNDEDEWFYNEFNRKKGYVNSNYLMKIGYD